MTHSKNNNVCSISSTDQLAQNLAYLHFDLVISFLILDLNAVEMVLEISNELVTLMPSIGFVLQYYMT